MWSKWIFLLVILAAALTHTYARPAEEDDDTDSSDAANLPTPLSQHDDSLRQPEAESEDDDDDDETTTADNNESTGTATAVLEQTDTTLSASEGSTTISSAPDGSYFVRADDNTICAAIKLEVMLELIIPASTDNKTKNIEEKDRYPSSGDCGEGNQKPRLTIERDDDIDLIFMFEKTDDGKSWALTSMELQLNPSKLFEKDDEPTSQTLTTQDLPTIEAPLGDSFSCTDPLLTKVYFYNDDTLAAYAVINSITAQAFDVPNEFGPERSCGAVSNEVVAPGKRIDHRSDTAPIAVGLTMAILTLFAVTGFAVHRITHQKKVDYSNM